MKYNQLSHEDFLNRVKDKPYTVLGKYINAHSRIDVQCNECNRVWSPKAMGLLAGRGCRKCSRNVLGKSQRRSHDDFICELSVVNPTISPLSPYIKRNEYMTVACDKCFHAWEVTAQNLLQGKGCPKCNKGSFKPDTDIAYLYVYNLGDTWLGYGITAHLHTRLSTHKRAFKSANITGELLHTFEMKGDMAQLIEREIGSAFNKIGSPIFGFKKEALHIAERVSLLKFIKERVSYE